MSALRIFEDPSWRSLVAALLHTLWQGAVVALLLAFALRRLRADRQETRYLLALAAQFGVLVAGLATWSWLDRPEAVQPRSTESVRAETLERKATSSSVVEPTAARAQEIRSSSTVLESRWVAMLAIGWLAGVGLMLIKSAGSVFSAHRLSRGPRVEAPAIVALFDRLRDELRIRRPIRMVACDALAGPAVLGLIQPTLILPISLMTGMPPDAVRAILAHELSHIRRHDYAVNLAQMLIESLLFFNPMVWWLGRQVRIEREACCDALAVRVLGDPLVYSHALADWATRTSSSLGLPAWNGDGRPSTLLERIRRALRPADRFGPQRISVAGLVLLLAVGPILLALLWKGTQAAVVLAAQTLSPAQRIERIEEAEARFGTPANQSDAKAVLKGTIRTSDGKPVGSKVRTSLRVSSGNHSSISTAGSLSDVFSIESGTGTAWMIAEPDDYAPALVGPFRAEGGKTIEDIAIVLDPGFPYKIRMVDEQGGPIAGALVNGGLLVQGGWSSSRAAWTTDADGVATIPHAASRPYGFSITAPGFQKSEASFRATPQPGGATTFTLQHAKATRGIVVDRAGRPVADAAIRIMAEYRIDQGSSSYGTFGGGVLGESDAEGRFQLDTLRDGAIYLLYVESKDKERGFIRNVRPGRTDLRATVVPCPKLEGRVVGDLKSLEHDSGVPVVWQTQIVPTGFESGADTTRLSWRVVVDPNGSFKLDNLVPGEVALRARNHVWRWPIPATTGPLTVDLNQAPEGQALRRIVLQIVSAEGEISASGSIRINYKQGDVDLDRKVELRDGRAGFDAPVGCRVSYRIDSLTGYWFPSGDLAVDSGDGEQAVELRAVAAGAIVGRVLSADGAPIVENVSLNCKAVANPPGLEQQYLHVNNVSVDADGRFFISPLPLGGTYAVVASRGHAPQASDTIRLDDAAPTREVEIRLPRTAASSGRVLSPDGLPLRDAPVSLALDNPIVGTSWGPPVLTDHDGRFQFDDLAADRDGYAVKLDFRKDFQPVKAPLRPGGAPVEIQVERGGRLEGRVVEASSGRPIPGVAMYAMTHTPGAPTSYRRFEPESVTDQDGRFRFSNLPDQPVELNDGDGLQWESPTTREARPGKTPPILIRATLPTWSQLKPMAPTN